MTFLINLSMAFTIEGLRVSFQISKTGDNASNSGSIKVYNLSEETRGQIQDSKRVILDAGYVDNESLAFDGEISSLESGREGADIITTVEVASGNDAQKANISKSYGPGTGNRTIFNDIFQSIKDQVGNLPEFARSIIGQDIPDSKNENGVVVNGRSLEELTNLLEEDGFEWSIQDNELQILKKGSSTKEEAVRLTPETGLLTTMETEEGIKFSSLLIPQLKPGRKVILPRNGNDEVFVCSTVELIGDTHGVEWNTNGELRG